jgi:transposase
MNLATASCPSSGKIEMKLPMPCSLFGRFPFLLTLYADSGYQGPKFQNGLATVWGEINVEIVKRSDAGKFVVRPQRWIVERIIGWLNRCRRLANTPAYRPEGAAS